jgi:RND family efflux transporter MFP subunit
MSVDGHTPPEGTTNHALGPAASPPELGAVPASSLRACPILVTLIALVLAGFGTWMAWQTYMSTPWTRDGRVRAYIVTLASEVSGRIVKLQVVDNQLVHKGDILMIIDPTDYSAAVEEAQAAADLASANADNAEREADRRSKLSVVEESDEDRQTYRTKALGAKAQLRQAIATLNRARADLDRATIRSPVNGFVTNLQTQLGDYATAGQHALSLIDSDSYWVDAYFEESNLGRIHPGDRATVKLMGDHLLIESHVASIARGITVTNAERGQMGLAQVNPIFTWVRLAQRVPVRIEFNKTPDDIRLVAGQTASVQVHPLGDSR